MASVQLETKLQDFENEFPGLYLPTDDSDLHGRTIADDFLRVSRRCSSFTDGEIAALLLILERANAVGDRLLTYLMVITLNLLEKGSEKRTTHLTEIFTRLVHGFSNRYGLGIIASRLNAIGSFPAMCKRYALGVVASGSSGLVGEAAFDALSLCFASHLNSGKAELPAIVNAMQFYRGIDRRRYRSVLRRAITMPLNSKKSLYMFELGHSLYLDSMLGRETGRMSSHRKMALTAYGWVKRSVDREQDREVRFARLITMPRVCYEAGRLTEAMAYSHELLEGQALPEYREGSGVHAAETTLGLIALATGDVALAKQQLLKSLVFPSSSVLSAFGPSLRLAEELHCLGETRFVIGFLQECIEQFPSKKRKLADLIDALETGSGPEWGPFNFY